MARARTSRRAVVGLDIEPTYVAAAQIRPTGAVAVEQGAVAPLDPGIVRDGEVADVEALAEVLKQLFREHGLSRRVRLGVANQRIVVRTLDLPQLSDPKEIDQAVRFQAQEQVPMPLDQAVLDYHVLGAVETAEGIRTRVVLVAARRDMIERLLTAARRAGLRPEGIDLSAFAMIRALDGGRASEVAARPDGAVLYVYVGGITNLAVADQGSCLFTRVAPGGLEAMAAELAARRELTLPHAREWLAHTGLGRPVEELEGDPEIVADARLVLEDGVRRIADEIRNSIDFYRIQAGPQAVQCAILSGPAASVPGFAEHLASELAVPVTPGVVAEAAPGALGALDASRVTVAAGLAVVESRP